MTTLIVNIEEGSDARKIADAVSLMKGVAKITMQEEKTKSKWEQAIADGAVTVEEFGNELRRQIKEHFNNA